MKAYQVETNDEFLEKFNIHIDDLKNTSLSNLDTSLTVQKQIIRHTSEGIIIGFYIRSKIANLGLTKKMKSLYKTPTFFSTPTKDTLPDIRKDAHPNYLFVKCGSKLIKVDVDTIIYAHTDSKNYCSLITSDGKKLSVRHSITSLLKALKHHGVFIQTHRSYIINWNKVDYFYEQDQTIAIEGCHIPVGRTYKEEVYKRIQVL